MWCENIIRLVPAAMSLPVVISDFRRRRVSILWLIAAGVSSVLVCACLESWQEALYNVCAGAILTGLLLLSLLLYLKVRYGAARPLGNNFGAGDWCYMMAMSPVLAPNRLLSVAIVASLISLVWYRWLNWKRRSTIPFVTFLGSVFIMYSLLRVFCE